MFFSGYKTSFVCRISKKRHHLEYFQISGDSRYREPFKMAAKYPEIG